MESIYTQYVPLKNPKEYIMYILNIDKGEIMISIPLDSQNATNISKLYGNAPYFALLDEQSGNVTVIENTECGNGVKSAHLLKSKGITSTIFYHMGEGLYKVYSQNDIEVLTCKKEVLSIDSIYMKYLKDEFEKLDNTNYKELLDAGVCESKCKC